MSERVYNLSYFLLEPQYTAAVRAALESKVKAGLFKKDKEVLALLHAFQQGKCTLDQAERILANVILVSRETSARITPANVGSLAVLNGAMRRLASTVQKLQQEEKDHPDAPEEEISVRVMTALRSEH